MKRIFLASVVSLLGIACNHQHAMQPKTGGVTAATPSDPYAGIFDDLHAEPLPANHGLQVGDFVVYRFSGSYRDKPVMLTQKIVEHSDGIIMVDMTLVQPGERLRLRVRMRDGERHGEVVSVAQLEGDHQIPFGIEAYEKLMNEIVLNADANEGEIGSTGVLVDVGSSELAAVQTSYRVRVGTHSAVMSMLASDGFAWGDVGAEIQTEDGKLLYKAEIVDMGGPGMGPEVAAQGEIGEYDELEAQGIE